MSARTFDTRGSKAEDFTGEYIVLCGDPTSKKYALVAWPTRWGTFVALGHEFDSVADARAFAQDTSLRRLQ